MPSSKLDPERPLGDIGTMVEADLEQVLAIERASFPTPWTREHFLAELNSPIARLPVVREPGSRVVAYACAWQCAGELQINDVAVDPAWRKKGLATRILTALIDTARAEGCERATLEVRVSNLAARALYAGLGFRETGRRRSYYQDTGEDALLLTLALDVT